MKYLKISYSYKRRERNIYVAKDPAFLFYPGDWLGGTIHMTHLEKGCYIDLLMLQFNTGKFTEPHAKHMLNGSFSIVWETVSKKFKTDGVYFWNERLEEEKEKRSKFTESRRNNAFGEKKEVVYVEASAEHMHKRMEDENINEIIDYLNNKASTKFRTSTDKTKKAIHARLSEGYKLVDFKKVIDTKCSKWLKDPKMVDFLRPETLFGTKFESYLNEKNETTSKTINPDQPVDANGYVKP